MAKSFKDGLKTPFADLCKSYEVTDRQTGEKKTLTYLPWARAIALAERPAQEVIFWDGLPYFEIFGGAVIGVRQYIEQADGQKVAQDTLLPVLNGRNMPTPLLKCDSRDISDTINRTRAKSVASVNGVGLALYSKGTTNTLSFIQGLKITPDTDLSTLEPAVIKKPGKEDYIDWASALAAARLTDPGFHWEILWFTWVDKTTGEVKNLPVIPAGTGWMVAIKVTYKGETHIEYLSIMGTLEVDTNNGKKKLDHQPLVNPTAHDWHRATQRCLVKAIAFRTGYGISVYSKEELNKLHVEPLQKSGVPAADASGQGGTEEPPVPDPDQIRQIAGEVDQLLATKKKDVGELMLWLNRPRTAEMEKLPVVEQLATLPYDDLVKAKAALSPKAQAGGNASVH